MRVGVNALYLIHSHCGGTETYLLGLAEALLRVHPDLQLVFFTNRENDSFLKAYFSAYRRVQFVSTNIGATNRFERIFKEQISLPRLASQQGVDLLWSPGYTCPSSAKIPQVCTIHDMQYIHFANDFTRLGTIALKILIPLAAKASKGILTVSEFSKAEIVKYLHVDPANVYVAYHGNSPLLSRNVSEIQREDLLRNIVPRGAKYFLSVGFSHPHKNLVSLVKSFQKIRDGIPHYLILVGRPRRGEKELSRQIKLGGASRIIRIEWSGQEELRALYACADVFVFPSLYEGFGIPMLEAMTAGAPILASNSAALPEVGGEAVYYFDGNNLNDLQDKMSRMAAMSKIERQVLIKKGHERARLFNWDQAAKQTMRCFQSI